MPRTRLPTGVRTNLDAGRARRHGDGATLLQMLEADSGRTRAEAAASLGKTGLSAEAVEALERHATTDRVPAVRREAVGALARAGARDADAIATFQRALGDDFAPVAMYAAQALGRLRHVAAVPGLAQIARSPDAALRLYAVEALAAMEDRTAYDALVVAAEDPDRRVCAAALEGLRRIARQSDDEVLAALQERLAWGRRWRAERVRRDLRP